jgi:hypothetical protein
MSSIERKASMLTAVSLIALIFTAVTFGQPAQTSALADDRSRSGVRSNVSALCPDESVFRQGLAIAGHRESEMSVDNGTRKKTPMQQVN